MLTGPALEEEAAAQPESLIRSSCISAMPWDIGQERLAPNAVPNLPRHLATPSLMERGGDSAFYDEPELGRTTPPAHTPASRFTPEGGSSCLEIGRFRIHSKEWPGSHVR